MSALRRLSPAVLAALLVGGCNTFIGEAEGPPLPGERISVLDLGPSLSADPAVGDLPVRLPRPYRNAAWPQAGGHPGHAMHHLALPDELRTAWTADVGEASSSRLILAAPVVADGRVYALDAASTVTAFDARTGERLWRVDLAAESEERGLFGGGLAVDDGRVFATLPFARVAALDAATGEEIWRVPVPGPARGAPAVADGRVFATTIDNQLVALAAEDGRRLWTHAGITEAAGLLGGATPAVAGATVVVGYSSGEVYALRAETGNVLWAESLAGVQRGDLIAALADIRGRPVIDRDRVFAISNSGTMAAIDLRRGGRAWDLEVGGIEQPWVAGDFVYLLSNGGELICLTRDGRVRWIRSLPQFRDPEAREDPIRWAGPVLAGDRLIVAGTGGTALSVSPYTGERLGEIEIPPTRLAPVVADGTLYFLADDATLIALR